MTNLSRLWAAPAALFAEFRASKWLHILSALLGLTLLGLPSQAQAQSPADFYLEKKICSGAPDLTNCTSLGGTVVVPGAPIYYLLQITNSTATAAPVWLTEHYAPGFNPISVTCTDGFTATTQTSLGPINIPGSGTNNGTVYCAMAGYFGIAPTNSTDANNCVELTLGAPSASPPPCPTGGAPSGWAKVTATLDTTALIPTDISVTKTASATSVAVGGQVTYTITIKNEGTDPINDVVYLGPFFRLFDKVAKFSTGGNLTTTLIGTPSCSATLSADCLQATPPFALTSPMTVTQNSSTLPDTWPTFAEWHYAAGDNGYFPPQAEMTLTFTVQIDDTGCVSSTTGHGLSNHAFFDLHAQLGSTLSEPNLGNNTTAPVDVAVTGLTQCTNGGGGTTGTGSLPNVSITKTTSVSGTWQINTPITYTITVINNSATTLTNVRLYDSIFVGSAMAPFTATVLSGSCTITLANGNVGPPCTGAANGSGTVTFTFPNNSTWVWSTNGWPTLAPGDSLTATIVIQFAYIGCASTTRSWWPVANLSQLQAVANGSTFNWNHTLPGGLPQPPLCDFVVDKKFSPSTPPTTVLFDSTSDPHTYSYTVTYTNQDPNNNRTMFTVSDFLRVTVPNYAIAVPLEYQYSCSGLTGFSQQSAGYPGTFISGQVVNTGGSSLGSPLFQLGGGGVTFGPGETLTCTVNFKIHRPAAGDPNCMGTGAAELENTAILASHGNYNPNNGPPTNADYWEAVKAPLPKCFNLTVNKLPNPPTSTSSGPAITYTIDITNNGDDILGLTSPNWLVLTDTFTNGPPYVGSAATASFTNPLATGCPTSSANCQWITNPGPPASLGIKNILKGQTLTLTFTLQPPFTTNSVNNEVKLEMLGLDANTWYARNPGTLTNLMSVPITQPVTTDGGDSVLKICKVAGPGVAVGTPFSFTVTGPGPDGVYGPGDINGDGQADFLDDVGNLQPGPDGILGTADDVAGSPLTVPAGPALGGYCIVAGTYVQGTNLTFDETGPPGYGTTNISVTPPTAVVGTPDLANGTVTVTMGTGVTEVTYTNEGTEGYIEICKAGSVTGNFTFAVEGQNHTVPAGACSPAIKVTAGSVTVSELPTPGTAMTNACSTLPADRQGACSPATGISTNAGTSTVTVVPGDISTMTIATITNRPASDTGRRPTATRRSGKQSLFDVPMRGRVLGAGATTVLGCAPDTVAGSDLILCTAKVTAVAPARGRPTGMVSFLEGGKTLAVVPLKEDGTATLAISSLSKGAHALLAAYAGNQTFGHSVSGRFSLEVGRR